MWIIKCDRCGKEVEDIKQMLVVALGRDGKRDYYMKDAKELCKECADYLLWWLEESKEDA